MAKRALPKKEVARTAHRPKPKVMQAALLMWAHSIYHSADDAVKAAGGYASYREDPSRFKVYADIMKDLRALGAKLDALAGKAPAKPQLRGGCEDDQDCPDDQICVHGTCEPLYPQG